MVFIVAPKYGKKSMLVYITVCSLIGGLSVVATQGLGAAVLAQVRNSRRGLAALFAVLIHRAVLRRRR